MREKENSKIILFNLNSILENQIPVIGIATHKPYTKALLQTKLNNKQQCDTSETNA